MDKKLELLAKVPLLAGLDRKGLEEVGRLADEVDLPAGKVVTRQGEYAEEFFVIVDGKVAVERNGAHLADLGPGAFFAQREFISLLASFPTIQGAVLNARAIRLAALEPEQHQ